MHQWHQQPGEPMRWFTRFERYRLMSPTTRSLLAVYKAEKQEQAGKGRAILRSVPRAWVDASRGWQWQERAEAWDAYEREQRRAKDEAVYRAALDTHRDNALKLSQVALNNAVRLLAKTDVRLNALDANTIAPNVLPAYLRAAAAVAEAALNGEAQALAVDQMIKQLDGNNHAS